MVSEHPRIHLSTPGAAPTQLRAAALRLSGVVDRRNGTLVDLYEMLSMIGYPDSALRCPVTPDAAGSRPSYGEPPASGSDLPGDTSTGTSCPNPPPAAGHDGRVDHLRAGSPPNSSQPTRPKRNKKDAKKGTA